MMMFPCTAGHPPPTPHTKEMDAALVASVTQTLQDTKTVMKALEVTLTNADAVFEAAQKELTSAFNALQDASSALNNLVSPVR